MTTQSNPDFRALDERGFCVLEHMVVPRHLRDFEDAVLQIGMAECTKAGIDWGDSEPLEAAMRADEHRRAFLFTKIRQAWPLAQIAGSVISHPALAGVFEHAGITTLGVHQTLRLNLRDEELFLIPYHQDHILTRSRRSLRIWVALRDVDAHRGSMEFAIGSHAGTFKYALGEALGEARYPYIPQEQVDGYFENETICGPAGTCVVFNPMVVHRSVVNRSNRIRYSMILHVDDLTALYSDDEFAARNRSLGIPAASG